MKPHLILKDFDGSQNGLDFESFKAGEKKPLSRELAALAVAEGWAKEVEATVEAPIAEARETKVIEPEETKPEVIAEKKPRGKKR